MDEKQKQALHRRLDNQLTELKTAIANLDLQRGSLAPDTSIGRISRMEAIEAASVNTTKMNNYRRRGQAIQTAQHRLEHDPEFGYCEHCGELIPAERLTLMPEATHCVGCAE